MAAVTWQDGPKVERVLRGDDRAVLYLHGYWDRPETAVLGIRSYEQVLGNEHAQTVLHALGIMKTLVFVGCGAGLGDPNFGRFLEWTGRVFAGSEYRRYRLALASEPEVPHLTTIVYGSKHDDLAGFLRTLAPPAHPAAVAPPAPAPLPAKPRCFGREAELRDLVANLLAEHPEPAPILGPPGIGKSTLALAALHDTRVADRYGARRWFIRCDGASSRAALASEIARNLAIQAPSGAENAIFSALAQAPAVLLLDNAETPLEADQLAVEQFLGFLASIPGLALVATIRWNERPAGVAWLEALRPPPLQVDPARQAFLAIAGKQFRSDPCLDRLLDAVDRVPLAIALLAHQAEGEPDLAGLWQTWQEKHTAMLRRAGGGDRLTNIELSYDISLTSSRMTPEALRLLSILGLLPGGLEVGDLPEVLPGSAGEAARVLRKAGLAFDEAGRLRLLAPLREYLRRKYPPGAEDEARVITFYVQLAAKHAGTVGAKGGAEAARRLAAETANIEEMLLRSLAGPAAARAIDAATDWAEFVRFTGYGTGRPLEEAAEVAR